MVIVRVGCSCVVVFNKKLFSNTSLIYNDYKFDFAGSQNDLSLKLSSGIKDLNAKTDFDFYPADMFEAGKGWRFSKHSDQ